VGQIMHLREFESATKANRSNRFTSKDAANMIKDLSLSDLELHNEIADINELIAGYHGIKQ